MLAGSTLTGIKVRARPLLKDGGMKAPDPKRETRTPDKPAPDRPGRRLPGLLQWLLERLCMYPSGD